MPHIGVTPGTGAFVAAYADANGDSNPGGVVTYLVGTAATPVDATHQLPVLATQAGAWTVAISGTVAVASIGGNVEITNDVGNPIPVSGTVTVNALPAGTNTIGGVTLAAATSGGSSTYSLISAATTNATNIKASAGQVYGYSIFNTTAAALYVKLYDSATAPTAGAGTPVRRIMVPANGGVERSFPGGMVFASGIGFTVVANPADADATAVAAGAALINIDYK